MRIQKIAREIARELRKNQTHAEIILWHRLRKMKIGNYKFLRQHPVFFYYNGNLRFYIADYYCFELRLIIEVDGPIHKYQCNYDRQREDVLKAKKFSVIRFDNAEITNNIDEVVKNIKKNCL